MLINQWNTQKIAQHKQQTGQALLSDEQTLVSFSQDFGKLIYSSPSAVSIPKTVNELQSLIAFAHEEKLPITIRSNGLSQGGQSLPLPGGLTLSMQNFIQPLDLSGDTVWVEANASWARLLEVTLPQHKAPFVLPYNCNLSVAGVLSAGGVGSASFKQGTITAHVWALEVVDGLGIKQIIDKTSPLFHACLSGQGRFAVITKACIQLKPVKKHVKTLFLVYEDQKQWFKDMQKIKDQVDYMELFCSPSIQGAKLYEGKRVPMAQWLYALHLSVEYDEYFDEKKLLNQLKPWTVMNMIEESIASYLLRHNPRFEVMKLLGQWNLTHPWYECFIATAVLQQHLTDILSNLPLYFANLVHVVPIAKKEAGFLMFPEEDSICSLMILNPGIPEVLKEDCIKVVQYLDERLFQLGGKRYLSGFLGLDLPPNYWARHFGAQYQSWIDLKRHYDPVGIFRSVLFPE
jgi:FAD/FMN-containing dehydrogenase